MPKTRKKKTGNTMNLASNSYQASFSKYFLPSPSKQTTFQKRGPSENADIILPQKAPKLECTISNQISLKQQISSFKKENPNHELEQSNDSTMNTITSTSDNTKSKYFSFCQPTIQSNFHEKSNVHIEHSRNENSTDLIVENLLKKTSKTEKCPLPQKMVQDKLSVQNSIKYTPLEKQYLEFQTKHPDAVLLVECGYKYRFFGKDAEIANKDLNLGCYQYHNFISASIPVHRLHYYVRRLVLRGHKVGVIKQTESAAIKAAGDSKNELFARQLHAMYSKSTFIEEELSVLNDENSIEVENNDDCDIISGYLICIYESKISKNHSDVINIACVALQVSSGDIFYSSFQDGLIQNELESFLTCVSPCEILLPTTELSKKTERIVKSFSCDKSARIEMIDGKIFEHSFALQEMSNFVSNIKDASTWDIQENLQILLSLPPLVVSCLSALKMFLSDFKVESILRNLKNIQPFLTVNHMFLNAVTIKGLEILKNNSTLSNYGTLFWCMNRTLTKFGERLLKLWLVKPLKDAHCYDFLKLVTALINFRSELAALTDKINSDIEVLKLKNILLNILKYLAGIERFTSNIDSQAAKEGNKITLFLDTTKYTSMEQCKSRISTIEKKLNDFRPVICKILRLPAFKYSTVSRQKYLIEVPNSDLSLVPDEWFKHSTTKQVSRFQPPEVISLCKELNQEQERLLVFSEEAWEEFLNEFGEEYYKYKLAISNLAELDVYLSFAKVSKDEKYCRPSVLNTDDRKFDIKQGRHPMVVKFMKEENQFVANDISLNETQRCLIVTGPNMGGKSTYIRQTAIIALMAHIGCFVPADAATIPLLDGIYVRMGVDDDIANKKSTFMSEMTEASNILSSATSKSFVIFDELGRGTRTNDGTAIAYATLEYLIREVKCLILFVTHYLPIVELKNFYPENIIIVHMAYILKGIDDHDDIETVTFLYNVVPGISKKSYGINVAALAGISKDILIEAQRKSQEMEMKSTLQRKLKNVLLSLKSKMQDMDS